MNKSLAVRVINSSPYAIFVRKINKPQLRTFSNQPIQIEGNIRTRVTSSGWHISDATVTVVADGLKPLIGGDLYDQLGLAVTQSSSEQDEGAVTPEAILPDDKWENGYRIDIEVEKGITRATKNANDREGNSTDGEPGFLRTSLCRPIPLSERAVQVKLACKVNGKRGSKKNLEGIFEVLPPGSHILKVS